MNTWPTPVKTTAVLPCSDNDMELSRKTMQVEFRVVCKSVLSTTLYHVYFPDPVWDFFVDGFGQSNLKKFLDTVFCPSEMTLIFLYKPDSQKILYYNLLWRHYASFAICLQYVTPSILAQETHAMCTPSVTSYLQDHDYFSVLVWQLINGCHVCILSAHGLVCPHKVYSQAHSSAELSNNTGGGGGQVQ